MDIHVYIHDGERGDKKLDEILKLLHSVIHTQEKILMTEQEALAVLTAIDAKTNQIATALQTEGDTLQTISDEIDKLIAGGGIPTSVAARLQSLSDGVQGVSNTIDAHAVLAKAIAAKGAPVPENPVPPPTPLP